MNRIRGIMVGAAFLAAVSCGGEALQPPPPPPPPPDPGRLTVALQTPHADDGAIVLELSGGPIPTPALVDNSVWVFVERIDSTHVRVVLPARSWTGRCSRSTWQTAASPIRQGSLR